MFKNLRILTQNFEIQNLLFNLLIIGKKIESAFVKLLLDMSIYGNFKRLFNIDKIEGQLDCLHGIRFLSMGWVVLGHSFGDILGGSLSG